MADESPPPQALPAHVAKLLGNVMRFYGGAFSTYNSGHQGLHRSVHRWPTKQDKQDHLWCNLCKSSWVLQADFLCRCFATWMTSVHSRPHYIYVAKFLTSKNTFSIFSPLWNVLNGGASLLTIWTENTLTQSSIVGCKKPSFLFLECFLNSIGQLSTRKLWCGLQSILVIYCVNLSRCRVWAAGGERLYSNLLAKYNPCQRSCHFVLSCRKVEIIWNKTIFLFPQQNSEVSTSRLTPPGGATRQSPRQWVGTVTASALGL